MPCLKGSNTLKIRKAKIADLKEVHKLVNEFARKGEMIPRSLNELYEKIRDFLVVEDKGKISGVCALHILWEDLAEIRSLAVRKEYQGKGIGQKLVKECMKEAKALGIKRVFALTYNTDFFSRLGFKEIDKSDLPQKIWSDCIRCPKFPECDEHAMILDLKK
ncbi:MAG: GNAT family N-acetyltransferase [Nitrospirae bacterium GWC2_42_7]|nr:MAG: GNAT family N-acetyltransferase [Nitrospirae bacterium GWC2_42_7]